MVSNAACCWFDPMPVPCCAVLCCRGAGGYFECLEAFACTVTPQCVLSHPVVDLGVTFLGVAVKQQITLRNLSLLPVDFKWSAESADDPALGELKVRPDKGTLQPGAPVATVALHHHFACCKASSVLGAHQ